MSYARNAFSGNHQIVFARRVITRPVSPQSEDHDTLSEEEFLVQQTKGAFALSWASHGLSYGIPCAIDSVISDGGAVIANISRGSIADATTRYANVTPVLITVPREILAQRLAARGRESAADIEARLSRSGDVVPPHNNTQVIENTGTVEQAGRQFVEFVQRSARQLHVLSASLCAHLLSR